MMRKRLVIHLTFYLVFCTRAGSSNGRMMLFQRFLPSCGLRPANRSVLTSTSKPACALQCANMESRCASFFFDPRTKDCIPFGTRLPVEDEMTTHPAYLAYFRLPMEAACPIGQGYAFSASLRLCLKAHTEDLRPWAEAKFACESQGEQLAEVKTLQGEMFVRQYLQSLGFEGYLYSGALKSGADYFWQDGTKVSPLFLDTDHTWGVATYKALLFQLEGRVTGYDYISRAYMCQKKDVLF